MSFIFYVSKDQNTIGLDDGTRRVAVDVNDDSESGCEGCYFGSFGYWDFCIDVPCIPCDRDDKRDVIFVENPKVSP